MKLIIVMFVICILFPMKAFASDDSFVTIVNPIRISPNTPDQLDSLQKQYKTVQNFNARATWLLTYDVLNRPDLVSYIQSTFSNEQELGIYLEISSDFATATGVEYNDLDGWQYASSVFLSGYSQADREKLIDAVFEKFHSQFGYYPTSVGSWWTDAYSQQYMYETYGITANLGCADQFSTDGYQLWGQYWSTPFYPSKFHAGVPANHEAVKIPVVTMQWAARDPIKGYESSLYSMQDYHTVMVNKDVGYFKQLVEVYSQKRANSFGHVVVGLEGDLPGEVYDHDFKEQLEIVTTHAKNDMVKIVTMNEFAAWYANRFPHLSPAHIIAANDLSGDKKRGIWYQSPHYRIGFQYDIETTMTTVVDFRSYHSDMQEPHLVSPNKQRKLFINVPSHIDTQSDPSSAWKFSLGKLVSEHQDQSKTEIVFENGSVELYLDRIEIRGISQIPPSILSAVHVNTLRRDGNNIIIQPYNNWIKEDYSFRGPTVEFIHMLHSRKLQIGALFLLILFSVFIWKLGPQLTLKQKSLLSVGILLTFVVSLSIYVHKYSHRYSVPQGEIDALWKLKNMPSGNVLVYDNACLQCSWHTNNQHPALSNQRDYISWISNNLVVYDKKVIGQELDRAESYKHIQALGVKYVYLVKFEEYVETLPYSPGDLHAEKIFENANAEIWKID